MILRSLGLLVAHLANMKNWLFEHRWLDQVRISPKVISVGNLTLGGTGKTPMVDLILTHFESRSVPVALVSRNYRAQKKIKTPARVDLNLERGALSYGDEAWMLAQKHPLVPVYVGPQKWKSSVVASQREPIKVVVVDDGFQHRALHRDLDVVLLDATLPLDEYECVPAGRAREPWSSLKRAQILVLTKVNLASESGLQELRAKVTGLASVVAETSIQVDLSLFQGARVLAFAGLAHPTQFEQVLRMAGATYSVELVKFMSFPDHHRYSLADLQEILAQAEGLDYILTTEKDFVKLTPWNWPQNSVPVRAVPLFTQISSSSTEFYAALDSLLR